MNEKKLNPEHPLLIVIDAAKERSEFWWSEASKCEEGSEMRQLRTMKAMRIDGAVRVLEANMSS